ncbi:GSCOCG00012417001-RA-CDS, partial [Cotesia congregata]
PILCAINELDPIKRRNHIMLSSIWFGTGKPKSMNGYLKPFVDEATKLFNKGFKYVYTGQEYKKYVVILMGVCDSLARPILRCSTQFNGEYGCGLCLHPGESI